ncbi:MAG TPA: methylated-DNA--[protein]-cysteine S-methyltransferase [Stellaceae bacterium]|nr:methylated-DNA--[protein]-cysteine S-methyltransferase [Stellaceae bacterium]
MAEPLRLLIDRMKTPIGELVLAADEGGRLRLMDWSDREDDWRRGLRLHYGATGFSLSPSRNPAGLTDAMRAYFAGELGAIADLPTATGGTEFQRSVWKALRRIPCGKTLSYAALARRIGRETAVRAVGHANGANPISIVVPCHRVIGTDGSLTGYGGGVERKRWLLAHEGCTAN